MKFTLLCIALIGAIGCQTSWPSNESEAIAGRTTQLFDTNWRFHLGDIPNGRSPSLDDSHWQILQLPHDWSIEQPFSARLASGTGFLPGGVGWYRKTFTLPDFRPDQRISVRFDGVYMNSHVWINGHDLGLRPNGFVSFQHDLTDYLNGTGVPNVLAVRVDHSEDADSRFYTGSGIYRDVWLITTSAVHVDPCGVYAITQSMSADSAFISSQTSVTNALETTASVTVVSKLQDDNGRVVAQSEPTRSVIAARRNQTFTQSLDVSHPNLWSCDQPYLYSLVTEVLVDGKLVDRVITPYGIRSAEFDPNRGFLLNGQKTLIKGVCLHQDAGALGSAVTGDVFEQRLRLLREMGCNAIRTSHNPPSPLLLDWCDKLGFLVMDEAFDEWRLPKKKWVAGRNHGTPSLEGYSEYFDKWANTDLTSMVQRDRNHPSIIMWSIGNEIDYDKDPYWNPNAQDYVKGKPSAADLPPIARMLSGTVKASDRTRPVTAALATITVSNQTGLPETLDVAGYNYEEHFYADDHRRYPDRAITGSENSHLYAAWKAVQDSPFVGGQCLWTGFDYLGEAAQWPIHGSPAGDLDECGFKKPMYYFRQSLWSDKPMVYLAVRPGGGEGRFQFGRGFQPVAAWIAPANSRLANVICYTNCTQVELFLNNRSLGTKRLADATGHVLSWQVPYANGMLRAVGGSGCSCELTTPAPADHLRLVVDKASITADGRSLAFVEVDVVDHNGTLANAANNSVHCQVTGPAVLAAMDSGDLTNQESFRSDSRRVWHGQCLLIIRSQEAIGDAVVHVTSPGLADGVATLHVGLP